jgi:transposase InsO family protein
MTTNTPMTTSRASRPGGLMDRSYDPTKPLYCFPSRQLGLDAVPTGNLPCIRVGVTFASLA